MLNYSVSKFFLVGVLVLMAITIPIAGFLVGQNQDIRNRASSGVDGATNASPSNNGQGYQGGSDAGGAKGAAQAISQDGKGGGFLNKAILFFVPSPLKGLTEKGLNNLNGPQEARTSADQQNNNQIGTNSIVPDNPRGGGPTPPVGTKCISCAGSGLGLFVATISPSNLKSKGDANCDGKVDINDIAIWRNEAKDQNGEVISRVNWNADFNCDGLVNTSDELIWLNQYRLQK